MISVPYCNERVHEFIDKNYFPGDFEGSFRVNTFGARKNILSRDMSFMSRRSDIMVVTFIRLEIALHALSV